MARAPKRRTATRRRAPPADVRGRILDAALAMADADGWESVRLRIVAARLGVPMAAVVAEYRDLDAVADAWFAQVRDAMLADAPAGFADLPTAERVETLMMRWFAAAGAHKRVTIDMLDAKLYPSHPHHWVPLVFSLSRLIQLMRDAARLDAQGRQRQVEEVGLTALFLAALAVWRRDRSEDQAATRRFLQARLAQADRAMARLFGRRRATTPRPGSRASR